MLITGILNPQINSLLSRVRHTNALVIGDGGFSFWPMIKTVDISVVDEVRANSIVVIMATVAWWSRN